MGWSAAWKQGTYFDWFTSSNTLAGFCEQQYKPSYVIRGIFVSAE